MCQPFACYSQTFFLHSTIWNVGASHGVLPGQIVPLVSCKNCKSVYSFFFIQSWMRRQYSWILHYWCCIFTHLRLMKIRLMKIWLYTSAISNHIVFSPSVNIRIFHFDPDPCNKLYQSSLKINLYILHRIQSPGWWTFIIQPSFVPSPSTLQRVIRT